LTVLRDTGQGATFVFILHYFSSMSQIKQPCVIIVC